MKERQKFFTESEENRKSKTRQLQSQCDTPMEECVLNSVTERTGATTMFLQRRGWLWNRVNVSLKKNKVINHIQQVCIRSESRVNGDFLLCCTKRIFVFLCELCGPWTNVQTSKLCIKLYFAHSEKDTALTLLSEWVTRYESNATQSLSASVSLAHTLGMIIPLFNSAVWSYFTPVHTHWLMFRLISPPLTRLCVINNDRQKMAAHIGDLMPPRCQWSSTTLGSCMIQLLTKPKCCDAKVVGSVHGDWNTSCTVSRVAHICVSSQKRDHSTMTALWKGHE